jgi:phage-related protein
LKFLDDKAGFKIFRYTLPQPYNKEIDVYCPEWSHSYNFYDNNDIQMKFIQFRAKSSVVTNFDTQIEFVKYII